MNGSIQSLDQPTHYEILQVPFGATDAQIRQAFRHLIRLHHPDKAPSANNEQVNLDPRSDSYQLAQRLIEAYNILSDPSHRRAYDQKLKSQISNQTNSSSQYVSQTIDLSEFTQLSIEDQDQSKSYDQFILSCRCGGHFMINSNQMESNLDIISCNGCSLRIKVEFKCSEE
ncbi:hypothetical protein O181_004890 [Austropuccinia psidii MF-1]|uniref:Diphthamide biosynthesis protein 4 n=1 Tax=Austropuccinia psidii MF-1 TaxID=1389203 RepID=A0A9Q3GFA7_9BASI|nr:hypothetical protein [Austropuccinia psidii MF-1]